MTIEKKILTTIYSVLFLFLCLFSSIFIFMFSEIKEHINTYNKDFENFILQKTQSSYVYFTNSMLFEYSNLLVTEKNNKFIHATKNVSNLSNLATDIYSSNTNGSIGDDYALYPGVSFENTKDELKRIYPLEKFLVYEDSTYYSNSKIFYYSDSGFFLNSSVGPKGTISTDIRTHEWYKDTKNSNDVVWSNPYPDSITKDPVVTCSKTVYNKNNEPLGVIAIDFDVTYFFDQVNNLSKQNFFSKAFIIDQNGNLIMSSNNFSANDYFDNNKFKELTQSCLDKDNASKVFDFNGLTVSSSDLSINNWKFCFIVDSKIMADQIYNSKILIKTFYDNMSQFFNSQIIQFVISIATTLAVAITITIFSSKKLNKLINDPLNELTQGVKIIGSGNFDHKIHLSSKNEFAELADTINKVSATLKDNIKKISDESADKQKMLNELELGKTIQEEMLPQNITKSDVDIFAFMKPAKFVGGDFYDYFYINNNNIAFIIGDVAGKGVAAALFMACVKGILKLASKTAKSPKAVMDQVNLEISEQRNQDCMFVTAIVGFLNTKTYEFKYCIAGHTPPLLKKDSYTEYLNSTKSLPLGVIPDANYKDMTVKLEKNDAIIFYTDGVSDTMSNKGKFLGNETILELIKNSKNKSAKDLCMNIINETKKFAGDEEQFDDTTIMAFRLRDLYYHKKIKATETDVAEILKDIDLYLKKHSIKNTFYIILILEELLTNIVKHGVPSMCNIELSFEQFNDHDEIIVIDDSIEFDPTTIKAPDITSPAKNRKIGGLGLYLIRKNSKQMKYKRVDNKNINIIII